MIIDFDILPKECLDYAKRLGISDEWWKGGCLHWQAWKVIDHCRDYRPFHDDADQEVRPVTPSEPEQRRPEHPDQERPPHPRHP